MRQQEPISCQTARGQQLDWTLGALDMTRHVAFDEHVRGCPDCLESTLAVRRLMMCDNGMTNAMPALERRVMASFRAEHRRRFHIQPRTARIGLALAASVLILAAAAFLFLGKPQKNHDIQTGGPVSMEPTRLFDDHATIL